MKNRNMIIWFVAACLLIAAAYTVYTRYKPSDISQSQNSSGKITAPDFTLKDLDGNSVKLSDYRGKIVILNFWAVWCPYCIEEMPDLNELGKQLERDGDAVILAIDSEESEKTVKDYISSANIGLKVLLDGNGKVTNLYAPYGIRGLPTTFILNPDGSFYTYISGLTNKGTLTNVIEKIRKGEPLK